MGAVLISTTGQIGGPAAGRKARGRKPGMRVNVRVEGKHARVTPAPARKTASLAQIQSLLKYDGPVVPVSAMRVTGYKG